MYCVSYAGSVVVASVGGTAIVINRVRTGGARTDAHHLHHVITRQPPPDLSDCENILGSDFWWKVRSTINLCDTYVWYGHVRVPSIFFVTVHGRLDRKRYMVQTRGLPKIPSLDGRRILMVSTELAMTLFALLYAFPHIPSAIMHDVPLPGDTTDASATAESDENPDQKDAKDDADAPWFSVTSTAAMRSAMEAILKTSQTLGRGPGTRNRRCRGPGPR